MNIRNCFKHKDSSDKRTGHTDSYHFMNRRKIAQSDTKINRRDGKDLILIILSKSFHN